MRTPFRPSSPARGPGTKLCGRPTDSGTRASCPAWVDSSAARSRTVRAIGPSVDSWATHWSGRGQPGTRPALGRSPNTWFQPAGLRSEPMKSLPSATGSRRCASATAAPPLEPPALRSGAQALGVPPNSGL